MNPTIQAGLPVSSLSFVRRLLPVFAAVLSSLAFAADPGVAEPKTHTLFMGADFSIEYNKELYRVQDVAGGSFVINVNGREVRVPMDRGLSRFKIEPSLKLTEISAAVTNLKGERSYTLANDPTANFLREMNRSEAMYADAIAANNQQNAGLHSWDPLAAAINNAMAHDSNAGFAGSKTLSEQMAVQNAQLSSQRIASGPGSRFLLNGSPVGTEGNFDAMDVAFEISSERPLDRPYVVVIVQYRATTGKPGQIGNWVYARPLQAVGREPVKVHVEQGGFPPGFELQDFQVHVYNRGEEVATTAAPKRMELTRDEALQYVIGQYIGTHKGATLPPTPAMGRLPADLPARLANNEFKKTYYVKVTKDGKPAEAFADESCSQKVDDPYLQSVVRNIRFKPALEKGKPVDGVAQLNLHQLPI